MSISRLEATLNNTQQSCFYIFHRLDFGKYHLFKQLLNNTKVKWKSRANFLTTIPFHKMPYSNKRSPQFSLSTAQKHKIKQVCINPNRLISSPPLRQKNTKALLDRRGRAMLFLFPLSSPYYCVSAENSLGKLKLKQVTGISDAYGFKLLCGWDM